MKTLVVKQFIVQQCCGETRLNGVAIEGRFPIGEFVDSIQRQGYYINDELGIIVFKDNVIKKGYRVLILNDRPVVMGPQDLIDKVFDEIKEQVVKYMQEKAERKKKLEQLGEKLEQLGEKLNELSEAVKMLKEQVKAINERIDQLKTRQLEQPNKEASQNKSPTQGNVVSKEASQGNTNRTTKESNQPKQK